MDNALKDKIMKVFGSSWNFYNFNVAEAPNHVRRYAEDYDSDLEVMKKLREYIDGVFSEKVYIFTLVACLVYLCGSVMYIVIFL